MLAQASDPRVSERIHKGVLHTLTVDVISILWLIERLIVLWLLVLIVLVVLLLVIITVAVLIVIIIIVVLAAEHTLVETCVAVVISIVITVIVITVAPLVAAVVTVISVGKVHGHTPFFNIGFQTLCFPNEVRDNNRITAVNKYTFIIT